MLLFALLFLLVSVLLGGPSLAESSCDGDVVSSLCGRPVVSPSSSRIVGGHEARVGSWPWTVILTETDFAVCAGAILNERVILTAAHCFEDPVSRNASRWKAVAGKHHLFHPDTGEATFNVQSVIMHDNFVHDTVENDIALMVLRETISFTSFIRPICLPSGGPDTALREGQACLLAGWGETKGTASHEVLNQVTLPVVPDDVCAKPGWYYNNFIPVKTFCAGYEEGRRDACSGDSGGPIIAKFNDRWYVSGVTSWGYGCAEPRWPGIYTNVTYYLPWIHSKISEAGLPAPCPPIIG